MSIGNESVAEVTSSSIHPGLQAKFFAALADYWAMTKPEVNFLIIIATVAGFYLGSAAVQHPLTISGLIHTTLGTLLVSSGTAVLNEFLERRFDAQMRRTAGRPLPAGRIQPASALWYGILLAATGSLYLLLAVNLLSSLLAFVALAAYLLIYTPLKRKTSLCTLIGAFPGAVPPLIGWAAATGRLTAEAWVLFAIFFLWQFPHFMAIAWMYREDYARAGFQVLPVNNSRDYFVAAQTLFPTLLLVAVSLIPAWVNAASRVYLAGALLLSLGFFYYAVRLAVRLSNHTARRMLFASIIYLPLLLGLQIVTRKPW